jgi:hypothetical protein
MRLAILPQSNSSSDIDATVKTNEQHKNILIGYSWRGFFMGIFLGFFGYLRSAKGKPLSFFGAAKSGAALFMFKTCLPPDVTVTE